MASAMSSGLPRRFMGWVSAMFRRASALPLLPLAWGVSTVPGAMQLIRMPFAVYWLAAPRVKWMTPALLTA